MKTCKNCEEKFYAKGYCKRCYIRSYMKKYSKRPKNIKYRKKWFRENKNRIRDRRKDYMREYYLSNREKYLKYQKEAYYGK